MIFEKLDGGTLLHNVWRRGLLSEHDVSEVVKDIADGLYFLHQKGRILTASYLSHIELLTDGISGFRLMSIQFCSQNFHSATFSMGWRGRSGTVDVVRHLYVVGTEEQQLHKISH